MGMDSDIDVQTDLESFGNELNESLQEVSEAIWNEPENFAALGSMKQNLQTGIQTEGFSSRNMSLTLEDRISALLTDMSSAQHTSVQVELDLKMQLDTMRIKASECVRASASIEKQSKESAAKLMAMIKERQESGHSVNSEKEVSSSSTPGFEANEERMDLKTREAAVRTDAAHVKWGGLRWVGWVRRHVQG